MRFLAIVLGWVGKNLCEGQKTKNRVLVRETSCTVADSKAIRREIATHAECTTPFGKMCQTLDCDSDRRQALEYVYPCALYYYICMVSPTYADVLKPVVRSCADPLQLVLYHDSVRPGNRFRIEEARNAECLYLQVVDLPSYMSSTSIVWHTLSLCDASC